mmetsp:Transcript_8434/g.11092  ORF Transcript_8434/g.11092 Transcript_8434/m.11092 type:complete len:264 (-) Transcript_8434:95-886(-)|eukprot:CAMPEP_0198145874 /NCGR_PEP_ID=MMETSP1443-20131203/25877_1 /TAXON_ID=186043 /ORGANISM="Entomoneis sp., Strain CCMP2396" /LENGTH=263 /DNA_ID=CAMNT_0043809629 /DNA_START=58 /DNA_END=849 /DNA_ORIENTATION=+
MSAGPIVYLRWFGFFLPCFEKEEDRKARQALNAANEAGHSIAWYPKGSQPQSSSNVGASVVNFFKSAIASTDGKQAEEPDRVAATLIIRDNPDTEKPEIFVDPIPAKKGGPRTVGYKLNIQLHRIGQVDVNPNTGLVKIMAKPPKDASQQTKCLVAFELIKAHDVNLSASAEERDLLVHHFLVLMEWERQRRVALDLGDDDEEEGRGNFLTQRAKQATHFAQRELELQTSKRQRESRKAKLVSDSGGLKYTALAMMRNAENGS